MRGWQAAAWLSALVAVQASAQEPVVLAELDEKQVIAGQPVVLRVTVLVPTWLPAPPVFPSFELPNMAVRLPEGAAGPTSQRIGDQTWSGVRRAYHLYPMVAGSFDLPSLPLSVTYADPETRRPLVAEIATPSLGFVAAIPEGAESLDPFIAASSLTLEQTVEGDPKALEPGGAVTRKITAAIRDAPLMALPPLVPPVDGAGLAAYPDAPGLTETFSNGRLAAERTEAVTYVAEAGGRFLAPPVEIAWFNIDTGSVETARVDGFEMIARGPAAKGVQTVDWRTVGLWGAGAVIAALCLHALWRGLSPIARHHLRRRREAWRLSERAAYTALRVALSRDDLAAALAALNVWNARLPPVPGPEETGLQLALNALAARRFANRTTQRSGKVRDAVARLDAARMARKRAQGSLATALPPLNPA